MSLTEEKAEYDGQESDFTNKKMIEASQFIAEMKEAQPFQLPAVTLPTWGPFLLQEMALETYQRALKVEEEMKGVSEDRTSQSCDMCFCSATQR